MVKENEDESFLRKTFKTETLGYPSVNFVAFSGHNDGDDPSPVYIGFKTM